MWNEQLSDMGGIGSDGPCRTNGSIEADFIVLGQILQIVTTIDKKKRLTGMTPINR